MPLALCLFPSLITDKLIDGRVKVVVCLLEVELGDLVVGEFAGGHEAADLALAQLLLLALHRPRGETDAALVEFAGDEYRFARKQQVVARDVVCAA